MQGVSFLLNKVWLTLLDQFCGNKLSVNIGKTDWMLFSQKKKYLPQIPNINMYWIMVECVSNIKFPGLYEIKTKAGQTC